MAHKVKEPKQSFPQLQAKKSKHYEDLDKLIKELFGERTKENHLNDKIMTLEQTLLWIREIINFSRKYPNAVPFRSFKGGWSFSFAENRQDAIDWLIKDQNQCEKDLAVLRQQRKLCVERQMELESIIRKSPRWEDIQGV